MLKFLKRNKPKVKCDACGLLKKTSDINLIMNSLCICENCSYNILCLYLYTNIIKCFCPHCRGDDICCYCNTDLILQKFKNKTFFEKQNETI
jgi:hypothetical protein